MLKVSSKTDAGRLARATYHELKRNGGEVALQAVGAGAVNQAVKTHGKMSRTRKWDLEKQGLKKAITTLSPTVW